MVLILSEAALSLPKGRAVEGRLRPDAARGANAQPCVSISRARAETPVCMVFTTLL
jgi:hypothetical protein